ncbi:MAG: MFS transporter, partial [Nitrospinota bacterium]
LAVSHLLVDAYSGSLSAVLPPLIEKFGLSLTLAALLPSTYSVVASAGQPLFGLLADRFPRCNFTIWSIVVTGVLISALGWAPLYPVLLALLVVAGLSTAAYHPQAAVLAGKTSGERRAFGMAVFMTAGRFGFAIGPLIAAPIAAFLGLKYLLLAALPALAVSLVLLRRPPPVHEPAAWPGRAGFWKPFARNRRPLLLLWSVEALRTSVMTGLSSFLPLLLVERGHSLVAAGASVSLFGGVGGAGNLLGGHLADRFGRKRALLISMLGAFPLGYGFLWTEGWLSWTFLALLGGVLLSTLGVTLTKGQELVPESAGTVSSLMLGVTWTLGGVGVFLMGVLADRVGLPAAVALLFSLLLPAAWFAWLLPPDQSIPPSVPGAPEPGGAASS